MAIRIFESFSGYGSQSLAMERLRRDYPSVEYEIVGISEIDKYAIEAYNALHPNVTNYGDISKIDWAEVPDFDLFTWSFPCTDISIAGDQKGFEEGSGTASSLAWECLKAISTLAGSRQTDNFIIEPRVMQVGNIWPDTEKFKNRTMGRVYNPDGISPTINCCGGGDREPKIVEPKIIKRGNYSPSGHNASTIVDVQGIAPTVMENHGTVTAIVEKGFRIRKLTPRECFRLMGLEDCDIDKIQSTGISNSQQYKLAGNSIVVDVLYHLFRKLFVDTANEKEQMTLF